MSDESDLAVSAGPEPVSQPEVTEAPQGTEGQTDGQAAESDEEAEKSEAAKRREREKAYKANLRKEAEEAKAAADRAEQRRLKIIQAGANEKPPVESEFSDYAEFVAAKAVWTAEQRTTQRHAQELEAEAQDARKQAETIEAAERQLVNQSWSERVTEAKSRYADFEQVALAPDVPITPAIADMLKHSEKGPDLAYFLGMNKAAAAELAALSKTSPMQAAWALGRLEASISAPSPRMTSQTPEPIAPVRGKAQASVNPDKMSMAEYIAARKAGKI
jgi:DNA repair exonuclease SbcCD ATPase subunit